MMTLEEVWENLRQDPEIKATMEEVDKSYKLFKKIENLIVADLEAKLAEEEYDIKFLEDDIAYWKTKLIEKSNKVDKLKQQLAEKEAEVQSWKDGTMVVKLCKLEEQLAEKDKKYKELHECYCIILKDFQDLMMKEHSQNQTAIAELKQAKEYIHKNIFIMDGDDVDDLENYFTTRIKSLEGGE